jgi:hypothetical protein
MRSTAATLDATNRALKIMNWNYLNLLPGTQVLKPPCDRPYDKLLLRDAKLRGCGLAPTRAGAFSNLKRIHQKKKKIQTKTKINQLRPVQERHFFFNQNTKTTQISTVIDDREYKHLKLLYLTGYAKLYKLPSR